MFLYKDILARFLVFVKSHLNDIILFIIVALLIMLSFSTGYIAGKYRSKEPIKIENYQQ